MGAALLEHNVCVDYVCTGDADEALPSLAAALAKGEARAAAVVPGVISRGGPSDVHRPSLRSNGLSGLPLPDHADYFAELRRQGLHDDITPVIPLETSRCVDRVGSAGSTASGASTRGRPTTVWCDRGGPGSARGVAGTASRRRRQRRSPQLPQAGRSRSWEGGAGGLAQDPRRTRRTKEELASIAAAGGCGAACGVESLDAHILELLGEGVDARDNVRLPRTLRPSRDQGRLEPAAWRPRGDRAGPLAAGGSARGAERTGTSPGGDADPARALERVLERSGRPRLRAGEPLRGVRARVRAGSGRTCPGLRTSSTMSTGHHWE